MENFNLLKCAYFDLLVMILLFIFLLSKLIERKILPVLCERLKKELNGKKFIFC